MTPAAGAGWLAFWNTDHPIYVNARHRDAHYRRVAEDILGMLPSGRPRVLDYGCGEALHAKSVSERCERLFLHDEAQSVVEQLARRFAGVPEITVLGPGRLSSLETGSLDMIVVNSVIQYLGPEDFTQLLGIWRLLLKNSGTLVLADVVSPDTGMAADARALLAFARREGFLGAALLGLLRTFSSDYVRVRRRHGFARYREGEMLALLAQAGYRAERRRRNFGINPRRMTFLAHPLP